MENSDNNSAHISKATKYYVYAIRNLLGSSSEYRKIDQLYNIFLEAYNHGDHSNSIIEEFFGLAVNEIKRNGWADLIDDDFADDFIRKNDQTDLLHTSDGNYDAINRRYTALDEAAQQWLTSAIQRIARTFAIEDVRNYRETRKMPQTGIVTPNMIHDHSRAFEGEAWTPLALDRGSDEFQQALSASEAALREIEVSNGYAASEPEERNGIVETIRGVVSALKFGTPSRETVVHGLLNPLQYVAKKFADSTMGEIAKVAVTKLIAWLFQ